jgi:hypothetical protein
MPTHFMTVQRLVERLAPAAICTPCVSEQLGIPVDDALRAILGELAVERGFDRERACCGLCNEFGLVLRKHSRQRAA